MLCVTGDDLWCAIYFYLTNGCSLMYLYYTWWTVNRQHIFWQFIYFIGIVFAFLSQIFYYVVNCLIIVYNCTWSLKSKHITRIKNTQLSGSFDDLSTVCSSIFVIQKHLSLFLVLFPACKLLQACWLFRLIIPDSASLNDHRSYHCCTGT